MFDYMRGNIHTIYANYRSCYNGTIVYICDMHSAYLDLFENNGGCVVNWA